MVIGTRPEAIKLAPVCLALGRSRDFEPAVVLTGQHPELVAGALEEFGIEFAINLGIGVTSNRLSDYSQMAEAKLFESISELKPAMTVVQGDTITTMAGAGAAYRAKVPVAHVEAGLRTGCATSPWPEELIRRTVSRLASVHFAPTRQAAASLVAEGTANEKVHIVGNTIIDALRILLDRSVRGAGRHDASSQPSGRHTACPDRTILMTMHRRESQRHARKAIDIVADYAQRRSMRLTLVAHPSHGQEIRGRPLPPGVSIVPPMRYGRFLTALRNADLVVSDSGGIHEECVALGLNLVILRNRTERSEGLRYPHIRLADFEPDNIRSACDRVLLCAPDHPGELRMTVFGDGETSERIVTILGGLSQGR